MNPMFAVIDKFYLDPLSFIYIVYERKTKVIYAISKNGMFTLLVNPDGTPQVYDGE